MSKSKVKNVGITMGDPSGIGPEIIAKALLKPSIRKLSQFTLIGDKKIFRRYLKKNFSNVIFEDISLSASSKLRKGKPSKASGRESVRYLSRAVDLLKQGKISSLVTAPISKEAACLSQKNFIGHTEFLAKAFEVKNAGMMFVAPKMKTILVTRHLPLNEVSRRISKNDILDTISLTDSALKKLFKIRKPKIAVCGLNPHAGEGGTLGQEETSVIIPAVKKAAQKGINVFGPFAADTLFGPDIGQSYDCIVAMYHDQGLIPIKTLYFYNLVNLTVGLPFIRTSPAHGTAFNLVGKNKANPSSICESIKLAVQLS